MEMSMERMTTRWKWIIVWIAFAAFSCNQMDEPAGFLPGLEKVASSTAGSYPRINCSDDVLEPNDFMDESEWLPLDGEVQLNICGNPDWFVVSLSAGEVLELDVGFRHDEGDLDVDLWSLENGRLSLFNSITDDESVRFTAGEDMWLAVKIYGFNYAENRYTLNARVIPAGGLPDDPPDQSMVLSRDDTRYGQVQSGSTEIYRIQLGLLDSLTYDLEFEGSPDELALSLEDPDGLRMTFQGRRQAGLTNVSGVWHASADGDYFLEVAAGQRDLAYRLTVTACENDWDESNDTPELASRNMTRNTIYGYEMCPKEEDWLQFDLGLGHLLEAGVIRPEAEFEVDFFGPVQPVIENVSVNRYGDISYDVRARMPGLHYMRVRGSDTPTHFYFMYDIVDPGRSATWLDSICGDRFEGITTLTGAGDRKYAIEVRECSWAVADMHLHARLIMPQGVTYHMIIYDQDWKIAEVPILRSSGSMSYEAASVSHGGSAMQADDRTYFITIELGGYEDESNLPNEWILELRGGEEGW
jgi:hypothetical protein